MGVGRWRTFVFISLLFFSVADCSLHAAVFALPLSYGGYNISPNAESAFDLYPDAVKKYFDERVAGITLRTPTLDRMRAGGDGASDVQGDPARFTMNEELISFIDALPRNYLRVLCLGSFPTYGGDGAVEATFELPFLVFSDPPTSDAESLRRLKKPIVYLQGSIHGDEASGAEALLAVASDLASNRDGLLDKVSVVMVPRLNMDGAWRNERGTNGAGLDFPSLDLNRDAVAAISPVSRAVRNMLAIWRPDVCVDFHEMGYLLDDSYEYTADGDISGHRLYYGFELATLVAHPGNVPDGVTALAYELERGVWAALAKVGLETGRYVYPADMVSGYAYLSQMMEGAPDECISDSATSLAPSVTILFETRSPQVLTNFGSRVFTHYAAVCSVLEQVAARPSVFREAVAAGGEAVTAMGYGFDTASPVTLWVKQKEQAAGTTKALMLDPEQQHVTKRNIVHDILHTNEKLTAVKSVPRPFAYAISLDERMAAPLAARLALTGVAVERLKAERALALEGYRIDSVLTVGHEGLSYGVRSGDYFAPDRGQVLSHAIDGATAFAVPAVLPAGAYVVRMAQPSANLAALALEPLGNRNLGNYWYSLAERGLDTPGYIPFEIGGEWPVYRCMYPADLPLAGLEKISFAFPLLRGAYVDRALPLSLAEPGLPEGVQLGYRFLAACAAGEVPPSFEVFPPHAVANAPVDAWYAYERDRGVFSPLVLRTSDHVPVLTLQSRHIASDGEVLLIGAGSRHGERGERSENLAGVQLLGSALFAILTSLMESWRDWGEFLK